MEAGLAGHGGALVGVVGRRGGRPRPTRAVVARVALRLRRPSSTVGLAVAGGAGGPVAGVVGTGLLGQARRLPVRPGEGGLGRPVRTTDEAGKAIAAAGTRLLPSHARRVPLPRPRQVREALLPRPALPTTVVVVQTGILPARTFRAPDPVGPLALVPGGPGRLGTWMGRGRPVSPEVGARPAPGTVVRRG